MTAIYDLIEWLNIPKDVFFKYLLRFRNYCLCERRKLLYRVSYCQVTTGYYDLTYRPVNNELSSAGRRDPTIDTLLVTTHWDCEHNASSDGWIDTSSYKSLL